MDAEGQMDKSGILYEGNWHEWRKRMTAFFKFHNIDDPGKSQEVTTFLGPDDDVRVRTANIVDLVRLQVAPYLLIRASQSEVCGLAHLWNHLETLAQPFRLMDLPVALRVRIRSWAMLSERPEPKGYWPGPTHGLRWRFRIDRLHPIIRTSRQLRLELLDIAWSHVRLYLSYKNLDVPHIASSLGPDNARRLRELVLIVSVTRKLSHRPSRLAEVFLSLHYSPTTHLSFSNTRGLLCLTPEAEQKLDAHLKAVAATCQGFDLRGQALLLALSSKPDLWKTGCLQVLWRWERGNT